MSNKVFNLILAIVLICLAVSMLLDTIHLWVK
jgi:hypothetical protein